MNAKDLPVPKFKKGGFYVGQRMGSVGIYKCLSVKPVVLMPEGSSSFAFDLRHFSWVMDLPKGEQDLTAQMLHGSGRQTAPAKWLLSDKMMHGGNEENLE